MAIIRDIKAVNVTGCIDLRDESCAAARKRQLISSLSENVAGPATLWRATESVIWRNLMTIVFGV